MKAEALIELLQSEVRRLKKLRDEEIGAFFFIVPPEAEKPITEAFIGSGQAKGAFYKYLANKLDDAQRAADPNGAYIGVAGMAGRR